jgi:hypothetical protein
MEDQEIRWRRDCRAVEMERGEDEPAVEEELEVDGMKDPTEAREGEEDITET